MTECDYERLLNQIKLLKAELRLAKHRLKGYEDLILKAARQPGVGSRKSITDAARKIRESREKELAD